MIRTTASLLQLISTWSGKNGDCSWTRWLGANILVVITSQNCNIRRNIITSQTRSWFPWTWSSSRISGFPTSSSTISKLTRSVSLSTDLGYYPTVKVIDVLSKLAGLWINTNKLILYSQATHIRYVSLPSTEDLLHFSCWLSRHVWCLEQFEPISSQWKVIG